MGKMWPLGLMELEILGLVIDMQGLPRRMRRVRKEWGY